MVNNLNDGLAWGVFPILFARHGLTVSQIGVLAALYPAVWGTLHRRTVGPDRPQMADRCRDARAGRGARTASPPALLSAYGR